MTSMLGVTDGSIGTDRTFASLAEYGPPVFLTSSKTYFSGYSPLDTGYEPWVTDGTAAGTHILRDLTPGTGSSEIKWFADYHGTTLFSLSTQANGPQLWKTDGTADGTTLISNIDPEPAADPSVIDNFPAHGTAGGDFYFVGHDPVVGTELYVYTHDAPKVTDDSGSSADGKAVTLSVLANDTNGDGTIDTSSVKIAAAPAHGTATAGADGTVTYTPAAGYSGSDTFNYTVADTVGKRSAAATVTLTVTATATTPPANNGGGGGGALRIVDLAALFAALVVFRISARSTVSPGRARR
jgi:ELWxxDGT repeat protein